MFAALPSCVLVLLVGSAAQRPTQPDFSGDWVLVKVNGSPSGQASSLTVGQTVTRTTARGEPMTPWFSGLTVERHFEPPAPPKTQNFLIGVIGGTVGGIPPGTSSSQGEWTTVAVNWRGDELVIRTTTTSQAPGEPGPWAEHEEVWSLDSAGKLLITVTDRSSASTPTIVRLTYRRRATPAPLELARRGVCELRSPRIGMPDPLNANPAPPALV